ncbi:hypothetical protein D3C86_1439930 [compost metagenome]
MGEVLDVHAIEVVRLVRRVEVVAQRFKHYLGVVYVIEGFAAKLIAYRHEDAAVYSQLGEPGLQALDQVGLHRVRVGDDAIVGIAPRCPACAL